MYPTNYTKIFLTFLILKIIVESYLDRRNYRHILKMRSAVPKRFESQITLLDHQKAADYSLEKIKTAQFFHFINLIIFLIFTLGQGIELLTRISLTLNFDSKICGLIFFFLLAFISALLSLPESIYTTFVIEEKYGFNKTTWKTFILDLFKASLLSIIIGSPIIYVILSIMEHLGNLWWLYAFLFLTSVQLLLIFIYPTFIAPLFNKFTELSDGELKTKIINLLERCDFKAHGLFVMDASKRSSHGNAYFTGFGKNKRIVFFDTLIQSLDEDEVESVLAHELGHMKKHHILKSMIKSFALSFVGFYFINYLKNDSSFFHGHGVITITNANTLALFSMVAGVYTFFITPISSWMSRKNEYEADEFAAKNASSNKLISALVKMYNDNKSSLTPDPMYSKFYYSHPPAIERIEFLEKFNS